jgi:hypothetical protein
MDPYLTPSEKEKRARRPSVAHVIFSLSPVVLKRLNGTGVMSEKEMKRLTFPQAQALDPTDKVSQLCHTQHYISQHSICGCSLRLRDSCFSYNARCYSLLCVCDCALYNRRCRCLAPTLADPKSVRQSHTQYRSIHIHIQCYMYVHICVCIYVTAFEGMKHRTVGLLSGTLVLFNVRGDLRRRRHKVD